MPQGHWSKSTLPLAVGRLPRLDSETEKNFLKSPGRQEPEGADGVRGPSEALEVMGSGPAKASGERMTVGPCQWLSRLMVKTLLPGSGTVL